MRSHTAQAGYFRGDDVLDRQAAREVEHAGVATYSYRSRPLHMGMWRGPSPTDWSTISIVLDDLRHLSEGTGKVHEADCDCLLHRAGDNHGRHATRRAGQDNHLL